MLSATPQILLSDGEGDEYEGKDGNQQDDANNVQLPEEVNSEASSPKHLIG